MKTPIFSSNREGESIITGYEYTAPNKKEQEAQEAGIKLAREIGRERAACRAPLREKIKPYLIETDADDR